jgi:crotonobetainyl-CoA:carnitine CoA-transferase CaiB-like acyl-CoA transferase
VDVPQPGSQKPVTVAGVPLKCSQTPGRITNRGPLLGEHDYDEVLSAWTDDPRRDTTN